VGKTWQSVKLPPEILYRGLFFLDARRAFIVGDAGTLLASEDGGKTWAPRKIPATDNLTDITFVGESGWIVGHSGLVLHTSDGGDVDEGVGERFEAVTLDDGEHEPMVGEVFRPGWKLKGRVMRPAMVTGFPQSLRVS